MAAILEYNSNYTLRGQVQADNAYLGGELSGGKAGCGLKNKIPFIAALSLYDEGHPLYQSLPLTACIGDWVNPTIVDPEKQTII